MVLRLGWLWFCSKALKCIFSCCFGLDKEANCPLSDSLWASPFLLPSWPFHRGEQGWDSLWGGTLPLHLRFIHHVLWPLFSHLHQISKNPCNGLACNQLASCVFCARPRILLFCYISLFECKCLGGNSRSLLSTDPTVPCCLPPCPAGSCICAPFPDPLGNYHDTLENTSSSFFKAGHPIFPWAQWGEFAKLTSFCCLITDTAVWLCFSVIFGTRCVTTVFQPGRVILIPQIPRY